jgi:hypothetical protein
MIIGLYGYSRAGKDTVARILVENHGFEQRNMAGPIREILLRIDPYVLDEDNTYFTLSSQVEEFGWDNVKAWYPESVEMMINLGQAMRDIDPDIWLNACIGQPYKNLVIADVRQPNEADFIYNHEGVLWNIRSERAQKRGMDGILDDYYFEYKIDNNGTIEELEAHIGEIMQRKLS